MGRGEGVDYILAAIQKLISVLFSTGAHSHYIELYISCPVHTPNTQ